MRQSQRAKAFQLVSTEREPLKPKVGFVYKIEDAEGLHKMIAGNRLQGTFNNGDFVLAMRKRGDQMVYMPLAGDPTDGNSLIEADPYTTFTIYGKPGPTVREVPAWFIAGLMNVGVVPVPSNASDIENNDFYGTPGSIQMVEPADDLGMSFRHNSVETASMKGRLKEGDLVLIVKYLNNGRCECALMEPLTLGWREQPDSRFIADKPYFGRTAAILGGHEYLTVTQGGFAHYKDNKRMLDFGRMEVLNEVQRGWPQP